MGQITIRELGNMDFFREIPKDILQNLLNESKIVSYKKKEVIFHSRSRTKTVYFVYSGEVMLYNLTKHGNRKVIFILGKGRLLNQSIVSKKPNALFCDLQRWLLLTEAPYNQKFSQEFDRVESADFYKNHDPKDAEVANYRRELILTRNFNTKHYWFPLPIKETQLYPEFNQNPGW